MGDLENNSHIEVVDHASEDDQLAETIRGSLEKSVYGRAEGSGTEVGGNAVHESSTDRTAGNGDETVASGTADATEAPVNADGMESKAGGSQADTHVNTETAAAPAKDSGIEDSAEIQEDDFRIVNVMAEILRQRNVPKTMERLGCCTCSRCKADVIAMTLSALPAKYCVTSGSNKSPLINFYDQRYNAEITSSIMRSCLMVRDHPRHSK
ncbi:MAG: late competence development ComFB family protein [Lachnospiraceae bacterium]|nr:late competence development ComFB family protein [Lachnospiraceae bacterium]